jgi:hypothetical protein
VFNSAVDGNQFKGIETQYGSDVDHYTAFLVIFLSHIPEGQEKSAYHSILEKSIKMHFVKILNVIGGGDIVCSVIYIYI